ncbi:MAG: hypothetical protein WCC17_05180 [Candidatus Nitrosopolaris sp.]
MKLRRTIALSILSIALAIILFAEGPIVADHQAFAFSGKSSGDLLRGLGYGPCSQGIFMYIWCLKNI